MSKITSDEQVIIKHLLDNLVQYNPFLNMFYNPVTHRIEKTTRVNRYENYIHQIILYTDAIGRDNIRILIGDEVGLGKTVEAIRLIKYLIMLGIVKKILIITPRSVIRQWIYHDLRELLWLPGRVKQITREKIKEYVENIEYYNSVEEPIMFIGSMDLVKYSETDKRGIHRFRPYYEFISSIKWDLVIVDEVHKLGYTIPGRKSLRTRRLSEIIVNTSNTILLSATPSRGSHEDFINRLSLIMPDLLEHRNRLLDNMRLRREFYRTINELFFYRRTKEYVNRLEDRRIFRDLTVYMGLVELGEYRQLYEELENILARLFRTIGPDLPVLLKTILLKRALSSPYAFLKTLNKVLEKRIDFSIPRITESIDLFLVDENIEENVDSIIGYSLITYSEKISDSLRREISRLVDKFTKLYIEGDPAVKAVYMLIKYIVENREGLPNNLKDADLIIFSEYLDTVEYLYRKISEYFVDEGFIYSRDLLEKIIEKAVKEFCRGHRYGPKWCRVESRSNMIQKIIGSNYIELFCRGGECILLIQLSSRNVEIIPLIRYIMLNASQLLRNYSLIRVLLSTDVASEGLNLEFFNVVINYDIPWSPVKREQRIGRVYRLRQKRDCVVIDLVRNTRQNYYIYTNMLQKLFNMVEQRIKPYPIEAILLLKPYKVIRGREELQGLTEIDIAELLINRIITRNTVDYMVFDKAFNELVAKLKEFRELLEDLGRGVEPPENIVKKLIEIYGCPNNEYALNILKKLYRLLYGIDPSIDDLSYILLKIYDKLRTYTIHRLIGFISDKDLEAGVLAFAELVDRDNIVRYSFPVMLLRYSDGRITEYRGLEVLNTIIDWINNDRIKFYKASDKMDLGFNVIDGLLENVRGVADKIAALITYKLGSRINKLRKLGIIYENYIGTVRLGVNILENTIPILPASMLTETETSEPPEEIKHEIEKLSMEYIIEYFTSKGCMILEKHLSEKHPYDLLIECPQASQRIIYKVEVKGRKPRVLKAIMPESEIREAEKDPENYIVCIIANMKEEKSKWIRYCEDYAHIPKKIVIIPKRRAIIGLSTDIENNKWKQ